MSSYDFRGPPFQSDPNCRSCTDFKTWSKQSNKYFTQSKVGLAFPKTLITNNFPPFQDSTLNKPRKDCPLDKNELGRSSWALLHTMAAHYPENPSQKHKADVKSFFDTFSRLYPCEWCSKDFQEM